MALRSSFVTMEPQAAHSTIYMVRSMEDEFYGIVDIRAEIEACNALDSGVRVVILKALCDICVEV
ncbi:hypothetical protein ACS0TY_034880 [Phlomoides rotata]